jgi:hypothetical protein
MFVLVIDFVSYELGGVPFGLEPGSSARQLVGRGLLEGRGVPWLLPKQGLDLFNAPSGLPTGKAAETPKNCN